MADKETTVINWESVWNNSLKNKELFPIKAMNNKTVSISCPTRFSSAGELSIDITPSFNDASIVLQLLVFNDNLLITDLPKVDDSDLSDENKFNQLVKRLVQYELSNRVMERFKIKSSGFESEQEAEDALIDYINNKATESGRMFDDKLDELNDVIENKEEGYAHTVESIRKNRAYLLKKVESILKDHYNWKAAKNEDYSDSTMSCYDDNGNLMAVVTLADKCIIVDLAKDITAKVSLLQSDEEIESELTTDVDNAQSVLADRELNQLKDVVANNSEAEPSDPIDAEADYLESLARRVTKLESLYIRRRMRKL